MDLTAAKQSAKQSRSQTRNSHCISGNPIFSQPFMFSLAPLSSAPLRRELLDPPFRSPCRSSGAGNRNCETIPYSAYSSRRASLGLVARKNGAQNFIEFAAVGAAFYQQLSPEPFQPLGSLYGYFKLANLQATSNRAGVHWPLETGTRVKPFPFSSSLALFLHSRGGIFSWEKARIYSCIGERYSDGICVWKGLVDSRRDFHRGKMNFVSFAVWSSSNLASG